MKYDKVNFSIWRNAEKALDKVLVIAAKIDKKCVPSYPELQHLFKVKHDLLSALDSVDCAINYYKSLIKMQKGGKNEVS